MGGLPSQGSRCAIRAEFMSCTKVAPLAIHPNHLGGEAQRASTVGPYAELPPSRAKRARLWAPATNAKSILQSPGAHSNDDDLNTQEREIYKADASAFVKVAFRTVVDRDERCDPPLGGRA